MKITIIVALLIGVWSLAARCNSDALVENPKTVSPETIVTDGGNGLSESTDSPATVDKNTAAVATPKSARPGSNDTNGENGINPQDTDDAQIAREVNEIMSHGREVFRQECHDYGPTAVPYLLDMLQKQKPTEDGGRVAMCLGAIGDKQSVAPLIERIESVRKAGGGVGDLVQSLGYLAAQGSDDAFQFLVDSIQPVNWDRNAKDQSLQTAVWALAKSNRSDAIAALKQVFGPLEKKAATQKDLSDLEREMLSNLGPNGIYEHAEIVKKTGIFGYYNSDVRKQKGIGQSDDGAHMVTE